MRSINWVKLIVSDPLYSRLFNCTGDNIHTIKQQLGTDDSDSIRELNRKLAEIEKELKFFKVVDIQ